MDGRACTDLIWQVVVNRVLNDLYFCTCMLLHLLYLKPTHALLLNTLSHLHFKTLKLFKSFVKTSLKPYMFRSLLYDHPQGSSSILSALPLLRLLASSFAYSVCGRMPSTCMCVRCTCLWVVWSFHGQTTHRQVHRTHIHIDDIRPHTE
jgi:hypothetical protein